MRTSVLFMNKRQSKQVFMLTSPSPSDGKSTTIANLAVSMAQTGKRVLLVDADLRRPTVAKTFGIERSPGLTDFLLDELPLAKCICQCEQTNLSILASGSRTSEPSELLESERLADMIDEARREFDVIFIDTPPVLAVADPAIVALNVDSCLLAIRVEKNNRTLVERSAEVLREQSTPIDGVIVNSADSLGGGYGYASYNYYGKKEYGYVSSYRRYYEADDDDDSGTTPSTPRISPRDESAKTSGTANGHETRLPTEVNGGVTTNGVSSSA